MSTFPLKEIREEFPGLSQKIYGQPLVYLDNAATTLKPRCVVDRLSHFNLMEASNVHRGAHYLSDQATGAFEESREIVARFLNASEKHIVIFTRGTTEGINLLVSSLSENLAEGDEVLLTEMEHHSNLVPWQIMAKKRRVKLCFVKVSPSGELDLESFRSQLTAKTKIFSFVHCSNTLGTINPAKELITEARKVGALTIVDAAQSVSYLELDVNDLDCDFLVFSGHKIFSPFGIGVLCGRKLLLDKLPPYQSGGSMIDHVCLEKTTFISAPHRFEAGTPHISGGIGLGQALKFFAGLGYKAVQSHENSLAELARKGLSEIEGIRFIGEARQRGNIVSFIFDGIHSSDIGQILDRQGLAVRTGHHCTQPLMERMGVPGTIRASFSIYNTEEEVERLISGMRKAKEFFV